MSAFIATTGDSARGLSLISMNTVPIVSSFSHSAATIFPTYFGFGPVEFWEVVLSTHSRFRCSPPMSLYHFDRTPSPTLAIHVVSPLWLFEKLGLS